MLVLELKFEIEAATGISFEHNRVKSQIEIDRKTDGVTDVQLKASAFAGILRIIDQSVRRLIATEVSDVGDTCDATEDIQRGARASVGTWTEVFE